MTSNADSGANTLRSALANICDGGTITINSGLDISLSTVGDSTRGPSALIVPANTSVTINGNGAIIERNSSVSNLRLFFIPSTASLTLNQLTLKNGSVKGGNGGTSAGGGMGASGAIFNEGSLIIQRVTFSGNSATGGDGGAVLSFLACGGASSYCYHFPTTTRRLDSIQEVQSCRNGGL